MARRIVNRKEKRAEYDAAERRKADSEEVDEAEDEVEEEGEEEEGEGDDEEEESEESDADEDEAGDDDEEAPKKKKPKPKPKAPPKPKRTRTPKITRMRVIWVVFNNSNQRVAEFEYPKRKDADEMAAKLTADKKNTHFVQPVKVAME